MAEHPHLMWQMSDKFPTHGFDGEPQQEPDPVAQFCEELSTPLEVIANLIFVATQESVDSVQVQEWLRVANEKLQDVREVVYARCRFDHGPTRRIS
jgi:hypothetical protein